MTNIISKTRTDRSVLWVGLTCFLAYGACYAGRNILSAMMPQIMEAHLFTEISLGSMGSAFLLSYGIGQLVNGVMGNKVSPRYMVSIGLFLPGILILVFPFCKSEQAAVVLWGVCGFFCSMLWGPISKTIGENANEKIGKILLTLMTVAAVLGMLITYILALISSLLGSWQVAFFISSGILILISILWFFSNLYMERKGIIKNAGKNSELSGSRSSIRRFLNADFIFMVIVTMLNGVIRNAVIFWIPTFISKNFHYSSSISSAASTILPVINIGGTFAILYLLKFTRNNEKLMCMILFILSVLMFFIVFLCGEGFAVISITALFAASAAMTGASNMIFSVYILRFRNTGMISGVTGFLDFSSYASASVFSLAFPKILSFGGWNIVVISWMLITLGGILFSYLSMKYDDLRQSVIT